MNEQETKSTAKVFSQEQKVTTDSTSPATENSIEIKELRKPSDRKTFERLFAINNDGFEQKGYDRTGLHWFVNGNENTVLLARDSDDDILGFLIYKMENPQHLHICCLAVDPQKQRSGVGSALISQVIQSAPKNSALSVDCRPLNEPYYLQFGFKTVGQIRERYYENFGWASPGLYMLLDNKKNRKIKDEKNKQSIKEDSIDFKRFIDLAQLLHDHSSWWFAQRFRSRRKESAFAAIATELQFCKEDANKKFDPVHLLRAMAHNALIVRGSSAADTQTTTGRYLLDLLNNDLYFATIKNLMLKELGKKTSEQLIYNDLKRFALINAGSEKSADFAGTISPYYHFYKFLPEQVVKRPHANGHFKTFAKIGFFIGNNYLLATSIHGLLQEDAESLVFIHQTIANICLAKIGNMNAGIALGIGINVVYLGAFAWYYAKQYYKSKEVQNNPSCSVLESKGDGIGYGNRTEVF
jgi:ribosomal protein S18 acetylase RimI-like enzyme